MKLRNLILAGLLGLMVHSLQAGDIYRWVDDQGQTRVSDVVPEKYRDKATRINSRKYELTSEQKADARDRAVYEARRARDENDMQRRAEYEAQAQESARSYLAEQALDRARAKANQAATGQASATDSAKSQCEELWRRYHDGVACFSRFAAGNTGGSVRIRPEAYQYCTDAPLPPSSCPPPQAR